jgi:DNA-directed RNA polymerase subunit RPC12/RpoP
MRCIECGSEAVTERPERTAQGYRRFRCRACGKQFNERSDTLLNRTQYPSDVIALVVLWRLRYKLSLRDLPEMFAVRGIVFSYEAVREWEAKLTPALAKALRRRRRGQVGRSWYVDETSYEDRCVKLVLFSAGRHRPSPCVLASVGAEVELRAARGALANLVSGGTASAPRSLIRVGGAPRRATPLYVIGAARQPTSRHGRRSLGPTRPVPHGGSGPICPFHSPVSRRPVSLPPCRSRHRSVRPASAPSLAAWYRPGGIARARSGAFSPGQRP